MSDWVDVCSADSLEPGGYKVVEVEDVEIAVFNIDGELHAVEDICTHDGEKLTGGPVRGAEITCPRHGARFCIRTGAVLSPPAYQPLTSFPVRVVDGIVQVRDDRFD